jgi:hypothetical protein
MDPNAIAGMAFTLLLAGMVGGFILLRPLSKQLGLLLESKLQQNRTPDRAALEKIDALTETVRTLETEVRLLSDRLEFNEKLLGSRERVALPTERG